MVHKGDVLDCCLPIVKCLILLKLKSDKGETPITARREKVYGDKMDIQEIQATMDKGEHKGWTRWIHEQNFWEGLGSLNGCRKDHDFGLEGGG